MALDLDNKKRRLLEAALEEFAEHGIAGARIERLAKRAGVSAGLVYAYFAGKDELFGAVYDQIIAAVAESAPIRPEDLGEYAGSLFDAACAHPSAMRFISWYALERGDDDYVPASVTASMNEKVAAIEEAQRQGLIASGFTAGQILALVLGLTNMWRFEGDGTRNLVAKSQRRETIVRAVRELTVPRRQTLSAQPS